MGENAEREWHVSMLVGDGDRDVIFYIKIIEQRTKRTVLPPKITQAYPLSTSRMATIFCQTKQKVSWLVNFKENNGRTGVHATQKYIDTINSIYTYIGMYILH